MTTTTETTSMVLQFLHVHAGDFSLRADTPLLTTGVLDSLVILELVGELERQFEVRLEPDEISPANFRTATSIARLIEQKLQLAAV